MSQATSLLSGWMIFLIVAALVAGFYFIFRALGKRRKKSEDIMNAAASQKLSGYSSGNSTRDASDFYAPESDPYYTPLSPSQDDASHLPENSPDYYILRGDMESHSGDLGHDDRTWGGGDFGGGGASGGWGDSGSDD